MDQVIGIMLVIVVIGLITDKILFAPLERFMHRVRHRSIAIAHSCKHSTSVIGPKLAHPKGSPP
jgi:hypothetical protein